MSPDSTLNKTYLVYYQVWTAGKQVAHGNIISTNNGQPLGTLSDMWRDWISSNNPYPRQDIFITGVFKL